MDAKELTKLVVEGIYLPTLRDYIDGEDKSSHIILFAEKHHIPVNVVQEIMVLLRKSCRDYLEDFLDSFFSEIFQENNKSTESDSFQNETQKDKLDLPVEIIGERISVRVYNTLKWHFKNNNLPFETIRDVVPYTENELLRTRNFGRKSLQYLKELIEGELGLKLGMKE